MILGISFVAVIAIPLPTVVVMPALIEEKFCQPQIAFVTSNAVELDQADFDLLMPWYIAPFVRAKGCVNQVGIFQRYVEQGTLAGCQIVGDRALIHVADIVQFMADT